jgi:hypothetical protein
VAYWKTNKIRISLIIGEGIHMHTHEKTSLVFLLIIVFLFLLGCQVENNGNPQPTIQPEYVVITVKFTQGTDIRLRDGRLVSISSGPIADLEQLFKIYPVIKIGRGFSQPEEEIESERQKLIYQGETDIPDLNLYFLLIVENEQIASKLIDELNKLDIVEFAELSPIPAPPPA